MTGNDFLDDAPENENGQFVDGLPADFLSEYDPRLSADVVIGSDGQCELYSDDSEAAEMIDWLKGIHAENERRRTKFTSLPRIDIESMTERVSAYLDKVRKVKEEKERLERELGRPLSLAEEGLIMGDLMTERKRLRNDLMACWAGFEKGFNQIYEVAKEYKTLIDMAAGNVPLDWEDRLKAELRMDTRR